MVVYTPKTEEFAHQERVRKETWQRTGYALFWEQGTGKSKAFIDLGGTLYQEGAIGGSFLLAPNGLHRNFICREVPKHWPDDLMENTRSLFWHNQKAKTKGWQEKAREFIAFPGYKILGMSYDGMMTDLGRKLAKEFLTSCKCLYGLDEAARIKEFETARTTRVLASAPFAPFRRILTGTPIANRPWDAFPQIKFLDNDFWKPHGLDSPEAMKTAFGVWEKGVRRVPAPQAFWDGWKQQRPKAPYKGVGDLTYGYQVTGSTALQEFPSLSTNDMGMPAYKNVEQLRDILKPIRSRVLKSQVFDLPPKLYSMIDFDLTPTQRRYYDEMQKLGFTECDGRTASGGIALTVLLRLQQIACGYLVSDLREGEEDPTVMPITPNPRLDILRELVEDHDGQGIIWARFTPDIDAIIAMLTKMGITYARYDGRCTDDEAADNEEAYHQGRAQWFVSNQAKGGEGLTLTECRTMIYYSNNFNLLHRLQSEDRPHRWGLKWPVNVIDLFARNTMEERLINQLKAKYEMASIVVGDGFRKWIESPVDVPMLPLELVRGDPSVLDYFG